MSKIKIYKLSKNHQDKIYNSISQHLNIKNTQTYYPILSLYFDFNNNYSNKCFTLKSKYILEELLDKIDINDNDINYIKHLFKCNIKDINNKKTYQDNVFIKLSPILDVIQYMMDLYKMDDHNLPNIYNYLTNKKINSRNNTSYIDAFSCFINSRLTELNLCPTFPLFYGTFSGIADEFDFNISEEYSSMKNESWFNKNRNLFNIVKVENDYYSFSEGSDDEIEETINFSEELDIDSIQTQNIKKISETLNINLNECEDNESNNILNNNTDNCIEENMLNTEEDDNDDRDNDGDNEEENDSDNECENNNSDNDTDSVCECENNDLDNDNSESNSDGEWEDVSNSDISNLDLDENPDLLDIDNNSDNSDSIKWSQFSRLNNYPVQVICMEDCGKTLDQLISDKKYEIVNTEWKSILFQICFGLAVTQKKFNFVHNDLHSSNIMLKETELEYLYFHKNNSYYKIPTFNKITKIIDFGRATFNIENNIFFSDVFSKNGDAEGQYSYPYHNTFKNCKNRPNFSFDLARLSTTIIEHFEYDTEIWKFLVNLITDKYGVCYLNHPDDFDLYRKIAKNINSAIPKNQLNKEIFNEFIVNKEQIPNDNNIFYY
jgi:hypothetical protein